MDLSNKTVTVNRVSVNSMDRISRVQVSIQETIAEDVERQVGVYDLVLNKAYNGQSDPQLMPDIRTKLESIPE